ncbi:MAG: TldD/PmbA family protein [Thermoleophilia bacterium]|nr:TldD/PmbA family protein [Thermoleophilia bacterium]
MRAAPGALQTAQGALQTAEGDEADVLVHAERSGFARFAGSAVHQPTLVEDESVTIRVVRDGRVGMATTNRTDEDALRSAGRRAAEMADVGPADPTFPGLAQPEPLPEITGFDPETAELTAGDQSARAWSAIEAAPRHELSGYFTSGLVELAVASTTGLAASQALTDARMVAIATRDGGSGYADATAWAAAGVDPAAVADEAVSKAERTRDPTPLEPATYRAVLEPYAVAELLWYFAFSSLNALALLEGRSYLSGRIGERIFHPSLSLADDALSSGGLPAAFDFEGVPKRRVDLVAAGVARDVVWDRRTAQRAGRHSTGHALPSSEQSFGPIPFNLALAPGGASPEELAEAVGEGIYVTRLHYVNVVDEREGIFTGVTRDGTFRIERGRVTRPLANARFTVSLPALLRDVLALGRETKLVGQSDFYGERHAHAVLAPALASASFRVTGASAGER